MLHRDDYIMMLEKRASNFDGGATGPDYDHDINSAEVANSDHRKNLGDNRDTLGGLFNNMGEAQKVETRLANKLFPSERFKKDTSSPLLKVAMATLSGSPSFQDFSPHYKAVAIHGFTEELEKIAAEKKPHGSWSGSTHDLRPYLKPDETKAISENDFHGPESLDFQQPGPLKAGLTGSAIGGLLGAAGGSVFGAKGALIGAGIGAGGVGGLAALYNRKAHDPGHLRHIAKDTAYEAKSDSLNREYRKLDAQYGRHNKHDSY
jgi:hypothetical protein